jgi:hypothetical protein
MNFAAIVTQIAESATDSQVQSGNTINVHGMIITNAAAAAQTVTFEHADDGSAFFAIEVPAASSIESDTPFLAGRGLQVTTGADTRVTIFHSQSGA